MSIYLGIERRDYNETPMPTDYHVGGMGERDFIDDDGNWWIDRRQRDERMWRLGLIGPPLTDLVPSYALDNRNDPRMGLGLS